MKRRTFLSNLATVSLALPWLRSYAFEPLENDSAPVRVAWITDVHHGYATDAQQRLEKFMAFADSVKPDFILQGGDFCHPTPEAASFMQVWNSFAGKKVHVLGNHDMDKGSKRAIMDLWQMEQPYYSFDAGAFHFVVLDCNFILKDDRYVDYANANFYINAQYRDLVSPEQIKWLEQDLQQTSKPTIIISHQAFGEIWTGGAVPNGMLVRQVIAEANRASNRKKVIACFCGHHHLDDHSVIDGVHYFQMNSASYYYVGDGFGSDGAKAMYADPLFAQVTFDPTGKIIIEGRSSSFVSPTPAEKQYPNAARITASMINRTLTY